MKKWFPEAPWRDLLAGFLWTVVAAVYGYEYFCLHRFRSWVVMLPSGVAALVFYGLAIYKFSKKRK